MMPTAVPNRLIREKSPYLLQHAHNPVDWYPWGPEAFEKARKEDKPLLVSIGYAACHWCHVMERESFEDPAVAALMNDTFICVKVDREERPDVDKFCMTAVQAMTGGGGWPLNAFLTPDGEPFLGGTYFPPEDRRGQMSWPSVVRRIGELWRDPASRTELMDQGRGLKERLARVFSGNPREEAGSLPSTNDVLSAAIDAYRLAFDPVHGGFSPAPKFPMPTEGHFLLRAWSFARNDAGIQEAVTEGRTMVFETLRHMTGGGLYDALGGGFSRYSTDERWHVPHFEKMLYDNAQLAALFIDAFQSSGDESFARTARVTLDYLLRDLASPDGGFYSSEDADSRPSPEAAESKEGAFYVWTKTEIDRALGPAAPLFEEAYGVEEGGNVSIGELKGTNVLFRARTNDALSARYGVPSEKVEGMLEQARRSLFEVRARRPRPALDDKAIAGWNGLAISALSRAAGALEEPRYREAAVLAAEFIRSRLFSDERFYRRWRDGEAAVPAMADDHAFLALGLIDLYETTGDIQWLQWARTLADRFLARFFDPSTGAVLMTEEGSDPRLAVRPTDDGDGVEPSAASAGAMALLKLAVLFDHAPYRDAAEKILASNRDSFAEEPRRFPFLLSAFLFSAREPMQIVVAGDPSDPRTKDLWRQVNRRFLPFAVLMAADLGAGQAALAERLPFLKSAVPLNGRPAVYVCRAFVCRRPTSDPEELGGLLDE